MGELTAQGFRTGSPRTAAREHAPTAADEPKAGRPRPATGRPSRTATVSLGIGGQSKPLGNTVNGPNRRSTPARRLRLGRPGLAAQNATRVKVAAKLALRPKPARAR